MPWRSPTWTCEAARRRGASSMDIGIATNSRGECSTRQGYSAVAKRAEQLGFAFIGVNDHLVVPRAVASRYPYSEDGAWAGAAAGECLDQLTTLAFIAG